MIACSSDDLDSEPIQARLNEYGFDHYITAPLTTFKVKEIIIKLINQRE
jgi:hypothetical protein